jgi:tRNA(Ile)-lysidine synthase
MVNYVESGFQKISGKSCKAGDIFKARDDEHSNKSAHRQQKNTRVTMQGVTPQNRHVAILTQEFLRVHWDQTKPLLLGYSGGPDSKALLYALLECGVKPHLAHVDHGWRKESLDEAQEIKDEAQKLGCPLFSHRLQGVDQTEDAARCARFAFFSSLSPNYAALLLAHHANDLAETVLKRVLEGAHLAHLGGMQPVSQQYGMHVWRPFLHTKREEILSFLENRGIKAFSDPSNFDPKYLRSRMRGEIFPFLNEKFGKNIDQNLALLSQRAFELKAYLDQKIQAHPVQKGPWGTIALLAGLCPIEKTHLLQKIARAESIVLSRALLETILSWVNAKQRSKVLSVQSRKILVDMERVWIY